jgi:hypothetical protein
MIEPETSTQVEHQPEKMTTQEIPEIKMEETTIKMEEKSTITDNPIVLF